MEQENRAYLETPFRAFPMAIVVPDSLRDAIYEKLAAGFAARPEKVCPSSASWDALYRELVRFFNENGYIPDFRITRKGEP